MKLNELRAAYHARICEQIIRVKTEKKKRKRGDIEITYPNFADVDNTSSVAFAWGILDRIGCAPTVGILSGQTAGGRFEVATREFIKGVFELIQHLRPGEWTYPVKYPISCFEQYQHLAHLEKVVCEDKVLATTLGGNYLVEPDLVIGREPVSDEDLNREAEVIDETSRIGTLSPLRKANQKTPQPMLHASISCKWTIRSDRAQNTRTEALNLIRNRKGNLPHVAVVTAEPLPTRISALALGTGDMDCIYHFALPELKETIEEAENQDQLEMLMLMVEGRRLRDISDLPFDLAI